MSGRLSIRVILRLVASTSSQLFDEDTGEDDSEDLKRILKIILLQTVVNGPIKNGKLTRVK